ncbi:PTS fructose transporter subunit IIC [Maledivibacter halophilus]|uniref:PTS system, fructose-specific IIC component n=1 Tax=Maledivibacter halophilus TaxID=36842 RepID=A0A1T5M8H8_9FIRM|nr:PTS fructose transporter subunit IIC [Maledivibacter halophilus]SKC84550.1 PTS system, fructose-specific IIC component [Maledivibacter halophilus]
MKNLNIKKHIMTGISYMIPAIVAGGLLMAAARVFGGANVGQAENTIPWIINLIGSYSMQFAVPILTAGIAYSICDKSGIAPGLALGYLSVQLKAGFLGGMLVALILGYFIQWIKTLNIPSMIRSLMGVLIIPFVSTIVIGLLFYLLISPPIIWLTQGITGFLQGLQGSSRFLFGAILGALMAIDMGGPINKTACAFSNGLNADGIFAPTATKIIGGMVPPIGIALSVLVFGRKKFNETEKKSAIAAIPMGFSYITEGVLPFVAADPLRVIISCMVGSGIAGGLTMTLGVESMATHGGIFVVPLMTNPLGFLIALTAGSLTTGFVYSILRRSNVNEDAKEEEIEDLDIEVDIL